MASGVCMCVCCWPSYLSLLFPERQSELFHQVPPMSEQLVLVGGLRLAFSGFQAFLFLFPLVDANTGKNVPRVPHLSWDTTKMHSNCHFSHLTQSL